MWRRGERSSDGGEPRKVGEVGGRVQLECEEDTVPPCRTPRRWRGGCEALAAQLHHRCAPGSGSFCGAGVGKGITNMVGKLFCRPGHGKPRIAESGTTEPEKEKAKWDEAS